MSAPSSGTLSFLLPATSTWLAPSLPSCLCSNVIFSVSPSFLSHPSQNSNPSLPTIFLIPLPCFIFLHSPHHHLTCCMFYLPSPSLHTTSSLEPGWFTAPSSAPRVLSSIQQYGARRRFGKIWSLSHLREEELFRKKTQNFKYKNYSIFDIDINILGLMLNYHFARCYIGGNRKRKYRISLLYFLQLLMTLQWWQNKNFN